jgi:hypothetical protein
MGAHSAARLEPAMPRADDGDVGQCLAVLVMAAGCAIAHLQPEPVAVKKAADRGHDLPAHRIGLAQQFVTPPRGPKATSSPRGQTLRRRCSIAGQD